MQASELISNPVNSPNLPLVDTPSLTMNPSLEKENLTRAARIQKYEQHSEEINACLIDDQLELLVLKLLKTINDVDTLDVFDIDDSFQSSDIKRNQIAVSRFEPLDPENFSASSMEFVTGVLKYESFMGYISIQFLYLIDDNMFKIKIITDIYDNKGGPSMMGSAASLQELKDQLAHHLSEIEGHSGFNSADFYQRLSMVPRLI